MSNPIRTRPHTALRAGVRACVASAVLAAAGAGAANLAIPGSGNPEYVVARLAEAFNAAQTAHRAIVPPSTGTAGGLRSLEERRASLARLGRALTDAERARGLAYRALGRDAVVFVAGAGAQGASLTPARVVDVYAGRIHDWRELGAQPGPIRAVGREVTDASRRALAALLPGFERMAFDDRVKLVHLDPQLIELLDRYPGSLGFLNRSALHAARTPLAILALEGFDASTASLAAGRYPAWVELGLAWRADADDPALRAFLAYVDSAAAVDILRRHGVVPAR